MFVQGLLENAAATVISASLSANAVTNWQINTGLGVQVNTFPCVKIICRDYEPMYKELNIGAGTAHLEILTVGIKAVGTQAGEGTTSTEFETVSDYVFNPFLANNIITTMATPQLNIMLVSDEGLEVTTQTDGWIAKQKLEVVCSRNY